MTPAKKAFRWVFIVCFGFGILVGVIKLIAPDAASVTLNGEEVTGINAVLTSGVLGAVLGVIFGAIISVIVKLATRTKSKA